MLYTKIILLIIFCTVVRRFMGMLVWTRLIRTLWRILALFWLVYILVRCLLWLLAFRYYFGVLERMSFSVVLQFSVMLQGFCSLVPVYLWYEYLLLIEGWGEILCIWFCGMSLLVDNHYNKYSQLESQTIGKPGEALVGQPAGCRRAGPEKGRLCCS
jgi:hypothetical protein